MVISSTRKNDEYPAVLPNTNSTSAPSPKKPLELRTGCWNIRRGLIKREKEIEELLNKNEMDILFLVERDSTMVMTEKDYKLKGFHTVFQKKKKGNEKTRIIALCKERLFDEKNMKLRTDLNSKKFPSIWLEVMNEKERNVLVCGYYREWAINGKKANPSDHRL